MATEVDPVQTAWQSAVCDVVVYPMISARTLMELGFEPFPLKTVTILGRKILYLPSVFRYIVFTVRRDGYWTLYRGVEACFMRTFCFNLVSEFGFQLMRQTIPNFGGAPVQPDMPDDLLTHYQSFRRRLRSYFRQTVLQTAAIVITQPLLVAMVREIGQAVGKEVTYKLFPSTIQKMLNTEGVYSLFAGLIPTLLSSYYTNTIMTGVHFILDRFVFHKKKRNERPDSMFHPKVLTACFIDKFVVQPNAQVYRTISRMMCVAGSDLAVAKIPYAPKINHWSDAHNFLKSEHLTNRACSLLFRPHYGVFSTCFKSGRLYAVSSLRKTT